MLKIVFITTIYIFISVNIYAQTSATDKDSSIYKQKLEETIREAIKNHLKLNAEQTKQWDNIVKRGGDQAKSIRNNNTLTNNEKKQQLKLLYQDLEKQINNILNAEQQSKFKELKRKWEIVTKSKRRSW